MSFRAAGALSISTMVVVFQACHGSSPQNPPQNAIASLGGNPTTNDLSPIGPLVSGWEAEQDGVTCRHPAVQEACDGGWCRIPTGCFIMGSPETEVGRGRNTERLTAVTLTHTFEIMQTELTQSQWLSVAPSNPTRDGADIKECKDLECPVGHVSWYDAVAFANERSKRHNPPLTECYELGGCTGILGELVCTSAKTTAPSIYECEGYRLPTEAEWEYAVRAGTRTAYYSGDITVTLHGVPDANLDPIAWYGANSNQTTHAVRSKRPNRWGLFDMLGNAEEWVNNRPQLQDPPGPLTDPVVAGPADSPLMAHRCLLGGDAISWPLFMRAAGIFNYVPADTHGQGYGIRLVRSLPIETKTGGAGGAKAQ